MWTLISINWTAQPLSAEQMLVLRNVAARHLRMRKKHSVVHFVHDLCEGELTRKSDGTFGTFSGTFFHADLGTVKGERWTIDFLLPRNSEWILGLACSRFGHSSLSSTRSLSRGRVLSLYMVQVDYVCGEGYADIRRKTEDVMEEKVVPIFVRRMAEKHGLANENMTYGDLVLHAMQQIRGMGGGAEIVCGPITTGGFGHPGYNTLLFNHAIELLIVEGRPMFNQIPYEFQLARLESEWKGVNGNRYCHPILTEFYQPLFDSCLFARAWFLPGWEKSTGATWEHEYLTRLGCNICHLPQDWIYALNVSDYS